MTDGCQRAVTVASFSAYALLVLAMWLPYSLYSGLPAETGFVYTSETGSALGGFLYQFDPLRIHTKTFYHLPYLISEMVGVTGSYVPFQVIHALLWWARGALVFLITRRLFGDSLVAYAAGALLLVHSSDRATQWIGQLNQFGFIFWTLLGGYFLIVASETDRSVTMVFFAGLASLSEYMSLWSYESAILLLVLFPLVIFGRRCSRTKLALILAPWYAIVSLYLWTTIARYREVGRFAYQATVIRKDWSPIGVLRDWSFNIQASLSFWTWDDASLPRSSSTYVLAGMAALVFVLGGVAIVRLALGTAQGTHASSMRPNGMHIFVVGIVALVFSFPAYLLLDSASSLWRTQFLSGIGTALVLASLVFAAAYAFPMHPSRRSTAFIVGTAVVVWFGAVAAIEKGAAQRLVWERQRRVMARVLTVAPSVKPNTIVVVINVPRETDPFSHHMWCDLAMRLAYPHIPVAATYFYADGTRSPGSNLRIQSDRWKWDGIGFPPIVRDTSLANTLIVDADSNAQPLVRIAPEYLCNSACNLGLYKPDAVLDGPVSSLSVRRYRLDARF
jgi:hypothetical protein